MMSYNAHCFIFLPNRMRHPVHFITQCAIIISFGFFNLFPLFKMWQLLLSVHGTRRQQTNLVNTTMSTQIFRNYVPHKRACCQVGNSPRVSFIRGGSGPQGQPLTQLPLYRVHTKNCNHFLRTFKLLFKDHIRFSRTTYQEYNFTEKCTFPVHSNNTLRLELFASPTSLHFSVHLP